MPTLLPLPQQWHIRPLRPSDNAAIAALIQRAMERFNLSGPGTAYHDPELQALYEHFHSQAHHHYWVAENTQTQELLGGLGVAPLKGSDFKQDGIGEFQKFYLQEAFRGQGLGSHLMSEALSWAQANGYRYAYAESGETLNSKGIFLKFGFKLLPERLGNSGHPTTTVFMGRGL